ncbi:MAG: gamma carbonic anhydrase family protein [Clostridiales bacterium]|uniref:gamma carbonic anhydrase family protein n=1 Tax=Clostridium sp. N3C TaxID=1776758 RepID=UPI00092DF222|nr:gamma carbonic anhydrase family protein [Clostridium sp. N3C]NLZ47809.1 gamma carbonic anhydrase family protein [Clostridiales bacterium]SCN22320.1 2,3,4,5-tetrahydropyridine-2,6-dicarboxylate N-acetyltransferase [Clostridium sp. N3C]
MLHDFNNINPELGEKVFMAEGCHIIGKVTIEEKSSIWFGAVLRGDDNYIKVGKGTNIQDNVVIHVSRDTNPTIIGNYVTVGHSAIIHGATIGDNCLIGMGSIIMDGCVIGKNTIIGAGSLVTGDKKIPEGVLCLGSPAKVVRKLSENEIKKINESAEHYIKLAETYYNK